MKENDSGRFSFEELNTSDWWIYQISNITNWVPGGVFMVCTGPMTSITAAGAWFYTAMGLFTEKKERGFSEVVLVVPPGTKQLNYRDRFKDSLKFSFEQAGNGIPDDIKRYLDSADWPWVQSDAEIVLEHMQDLPEMSAVAIAGAERLRFPKLERVPGTLSSTHTGLRVSHSSADDLLLPHLHELLRRLLKLAKERQLSIVVFVENFEYEPQKLPGYLQSHPELAVASARYGEAERSRYRATIEALEISRTSGLEAAIQFVRQNIPEADRQAHAISYLYSNCGLWTQAWDNHAGYSG